MLTRDDNETLTRTDQGTPMGEVMRRYWLPALLTSELPGPDCPPVRVRILGEQLVAFRDTEGKVGLLSGFCPHRLTSLFFGRNEEGGLRCVYHGWKFDTGGNCLDMMNEPPDSDYPSKIKTTSYPVVEMGDLIWTYLGPAEKQPPHPKFEWTQVPESHRLVTKNWQECNWLQALEGGIDTAHAPILHRRITENTNRPGIGINTSLLTGEAPKLEVDRTNYGYRYAGLRDMGDNRNRIRAYHYVMPFHQFRPLQFGLQGEEPRSLIAGHVWVPMDDENCMIYNWMYNYEGEPLSDEDREQETGLGRGPDDMLPDFRTKRNKTNDWMIDREVQKYETFTGIEGINTQDQAIQESMGPIVDRSGENLANSDMAIVVARQMLLTAAKTVADGGDPPGTGDSYYNVRAIDSILPKEADWKKALEDQMYPH
ncbi:MAG: (2Fe-2S)-binding protein [Chloroflexi bacterium]|jgi:phenylpropionate dioxygenase-like ring-hydroxylating dioxygenase large terminal subunit|nr:(2Fe-2S)-binding protein [Chloroflexota bacterium]MDP6498120.1 Rieske 2Fe-2S domain-containing protein [Dehalococcoidia bacterium]MDP7588137.1 Rieske 2Fe-2S domain-containing protein [Dehalococcoidia bacterium]MQF88602.1 Rieske 2Fe-2S domain-containing protein [SAR202 cluster bacterium]MQG55221.1 Rieske 2Fe-2S domain-containing protein [SAR202 cluster bacterium]|tara:strand:- start:801 stop:2075 length:1275 start_codon:yes stop_codon:yes gene_type:complete